MVDIEYDHLRRTPRRAAGLHCCCSAIVNAEEAHQAGRISATRKALEDARFARDEIENAALVHEIVGDRLNKTCMWLRMRVGIGRLHHLARLRIDVPMSLRGARDAISRGKTGVEPLRRVRRSDLLQKHVGNLVIERLGISFGIEVAMLLAP